MKGKKLLPIICDHTLGYTVTKIAEIGTDLPLKVYGQDDLMEDVDIQNDEPEILKYGNDIEMGSYSHIPYACEGSYVFCIGKDIVSGKMDDNKICLQARVCSLLKCSDDICKYSAINYNNEYTIFQVWANNEKKYHVVIIVRKGDIFYKSCTIRKGEEVCVTDWVNGRTDLPAPSGLDKNDIGVIEPDQIVEIYGTVHFQPIEGCKKGFEYGKDPLLELPVIFADRVDICIYIEIEETGDLFSF